MEPSSSSSSSSGFINANASSSSSSSPPPASSGLVVVDQHLQLESGGEACDQAVVRQANSGGEGGGGGGEGPLLYQDHEDRPRVEEFQHTLLPPPPPPQLPPPPVSYLPDVLPAQAQCQIQGDTICLFNYRRMGWLISQEHYGPGSPLVHAKKSLKEIDTWALSQCRIQNLSIASNMLYSSGYTIQLLNHGKNPPKSSSASLHDHWLLNPSVFFLGVSLDPCFAPLPGIETFTTHGAPIFASGGYSSTCCGNDNGNGNSSNSSAAVTPLLEGLQPVRSEEIARLAAAAAAAAANNQDPSAAGAVNISE